LKIGIYLKFGIWSLEFWNFSIPIEIPGAMRKTSLGFSLFAHRY